MTPVEAVFTVLCWNILYGHDPTQIASVIRTQNPDIVLLQEVGGGDTVVDGLTVATKLQGLTKYPYMWYSEEFRELRYGAGSNIGTGQAILSRYPLEKPKKLVFKNQATDWSPPNPYNLLTWFNLRGYFQPRRGGRLAQIATIRVSGGRWTIVNVHLESYEGYKLGLRQKQVAEILETTKKNHAESLIVAGDLNADYKSPAVQMLFKSGFDNLIERCVTSQPTTRDGYNYDWILFRSESGQAMAQEPVKILNNINNSDHYPLFATFRIKP